MRSLYETILNSTNSGIENSGIFNKMFKKAFFKIFGNYIYEKKMDITHMFAGGPTTIEIPFTTRSKQAITHFKDLVDDFAKELSVYKPETNVEVHNPVGEGPERPKCEITVTFNNAPTTWKDEPYFVISVVKKEFDDSIDSTVLIMQDMNGSLEEVFK